METASGVQAQAAAGLPAGAWLAQNSHRGVEPQNAPLHQGIAFSKPLHAKGLPGPLYDSGRRPRCSGKERDAETGLDFFASRYFSSAEGRFTSPDAMIMKKEWLADPQRWNKYAYVRNNPLRYIDPKGEDLTIVYSTAGLNADNLEWFKKNQAAIEAAITAKYKKAGVVVHFRDRASLTKAQLKELSSLPVQDKRMETFKPGLVQLNYLNNRSEMVTKKGDEPRTSASGFENSGRAEVFLSNIGDSGCGGACAVGNVATHETAHALGIEHSGFFGELWHNLWRGLPGDVMAPKNHDPVDAPLYFNTDIEKDAEILRKVRDVPPIY